MIKFCKMDLLLIKDNKIDIKYISKSSDFREQEQTLTTA